MTSAEDRHEIHPTTQADGLHEILPKLEQLAWPHREWHKQIALVLQGQQKGKRAFGFGSNKVRCQRAAKLALSIALSLESRGARIKHDVFNRLVQQAQAQSSFSSRVETSIPLSDLPDPSGHSEYSQAQPAHAELAALSSRLAPALDKEFNEHPEFSLS